MTIPLTWLGHASFRLDSPGGKRIYVDPWLTGNPKCPEAEQEPERVDLIALTHGHGDHVGDTVELWKQFQPPVVALVELRRWLDAQGVDAARSATGRTRAARVEVDGIKFTLTDANHSSSAEDGTYLGEPAGLVLELEDGFTIYFAGDTNVFGDMALIRPDLRAGRRRAADRRPLHDGPARGGGRARAARRRSAASRATTARSRC